MTTRLQGWVLAACVCLGVLFGIGPPASLPGHHGDPDGVAEAAGPSVVFNTKSLIYHDGGCASAHRCTANCVVIPRAEAIRRGGRPCKLCGG